jgi:hypothetical protein
MFFLLIVNQILMRKTMRNVRKHAVQKSDKDIYEHGKHAFLCEQIMLPPASISSIRDFAALTWIKGWKDARSGSEDNGRYGKLLHKKYKWTAEGTLVRDHSSETPEESLFLQD